MGYYQSSKINLSDIVKEFSKDIRNKSDAEKRLTLFISDRERGQLKLPKKKTIPT